MRVEIPGGDHWVEMRSADELTGGDLDAFSSVYEGAFARDVEIDDEDDEPGSQMELSPDGVSMVPKKASKRTVRVTMGMVNEQRDGLLGRIITAWSYSDAPFELPLPYSALSRERLPLAACNALAEAVKPHLDALRGATGPKAQTAPTADGGGLRNGSVAASKSRRPA